ncbi:putative leucine-rich repeat-containing protein [Cucumis melo var. makuwa]|uniref:Leucine-rich repeat-containing protein n=1 Tax=Cucumis melo var. makuwa TaxID=1194695 RepID=A0A5A7VBT6_CUCMM|nr:putative leucine-rich repeat-containing protein [Cucumis melo var. makuwa]
MRASSCFTRRLPIMGASYLIFSFFFASLVGFISAGFGLDPINLCTFLTFSASGSLFLPLEPTIRRSEGSLELLELSFEGFITSRKGSLALTVRAYLVSVKGTQAFSDVTSSKMNRSKQKENASHSFKSRFGKIMMSHPNEGHPDSSFTLSMTKFDSYLKEESEDPSFLMSLEEEAFSRFKVLEGFLQDSSMNPKSLDGGSTTQRVRCHECEVSSDNEFEEFKRALIVATDESSEYGCSSGQMKSGAYAEHRGSSSCVILDGDDLFSKWKEDQIMLKQQSERIQVLMENNHRYLSSIATHKAELKKACHKFESLSNSWKLLKTEWRPKRRNDLNRCIVAPTSIHSSRATNWYFDSGCSRHMTGNASFFTNFKECSAGHVMFEDGVRGKILGK